MTLAASQLAARLLPWAAEFGRHDLPWQRQRTPWRVLVAEVLLQQTQVATVLRYYERFIGRFPTPAEMAEATLDEVLALYAGLGYYARARNLKRCAELLVAYHQGALPTTMAELIALPGIGRSTAAAVLAQCHDRAEAICDGNVRRVLTRYHALDAPKGSAALEQELWTLAQAHTPDVGAGAYTQAIMDLGALVCLPRLPRCEQCPLVAECAAHRLGLTATLPRPAIRRPRPEREFNALWLVDADTSELWLETRPPSGLWGGLTSIPVRPAPLQIDAFLTEYGLLPLGAAQAAGEFSHEFTHFRMQARVTRILVREASTRVAECALKRYATAALSQVGLPAPVKRFLHSAAQAPAT